MKTRIWATGFCALCLLATNTACMTTSGTVSSEAEYEAPSVDEVGLEDGRSSYSWMKYRGSIPFATEAAKSTAVSGGKNGAPVFASTARKGKVKRVAAHP
jgi:hypothetical protein